MANDKTRVAEVNNSKNHNSGEQVDVVLQKIEDASDLVRIPPVFSLDSKYLSIASGRNIGVYSVDTGDRLHLLQHHSLDVVGIALDEDGNLLSCDSQGHHARWDIAAGKKLVDFTVAVPNVKEFLGFYYLGRKNFLLASPSKDGKQEDKATLWLAEATQDNSSYKFKIVVKEYSFKSQALAVGCHQQGSTVLAVLKDQMVLVNDLKTGTKQRHLTDERKFTCVALHREDAVMATGDISGRIIVWHDFIQSNKPVKTIYHWHTLPVSSLCFSAEGSYLLSGGSEKVLVKWRLGTTRKQCLPRLGATIKHIVNAPDNICVATCHSDNAIRFVDPTNKITRAVLGMVRHDPIRSQQDDVLDEDAQAVLSSLKETVLPAGLVWDPRSRGVFLNAQAGFLQLYDPHRNSMVFNMDVANRNILTDERNRVIGNAEVMRAAVTSDGHWLATLESWAGRARDIRLKFWHYDAVQSNYVLNTEVNSPHRGRAVVALAFQPRQPSESQPANQPCLVTLGRDDQFKIWRLVDDTDIYRQKEAWSCEVAGNFRQMAPRALSFSEDGSLLAIAFNDTVTLWDPITCNLNTTLAHSLVDQSIDSMEFGREQCFRYLVCATERSLFAWDVITQGLLWKVGHLPGPVACLVADPRSIYMAAVLRNSHVFVFAPSSSKPVYHHKPTKDQLDGNIEPISAVFIPRPNPLTARSNTPNWLVNSRLYIIDSRQEFYQLDDQRSEVPSRNRMTSKPVSQLDRLPWTPFAAMKAQQQISAASQLVPTVHQPGRGGIYGYESVKSLLETPASALPPMSRICLSFMKNLMIRHDLQAVPESAARSNGLKINIGTHERRFEATGLAKGDDEQSLQRLLDLDYQWLGDVDDSNAMTD